MKQQKVRRQSQVSTQQDSLFFWYPPKTNKKCKHITETLPDKNDRAELCIILISYPIHYCILHLIVYFFPPLIILFSKMIQYNMDKHMEACIDTHKHTTKGNKAPPTSMQRQCPCTNLPHSNSCPIYIWHQPMPYLVFILYMLSQMS